jgi:hypothetical protein
VSRSSFSGKLSCVLLAAGLLLSVPATLFAPLMRPMPIEELRDKAQLIIRGTVRSKTVEREADGQIVTRVELAVTETWKGKPAPARYFIMQTGGVLGDEITSVSGQEQYDIGEEVIAFLVFNHRGEGVTLGLSQGKFQVFEDPQTREKRARNAFHGRGADKDTIKHLTLAELKTKVKGAQP